LERMNLVTRDKYAEMTVHAASLVNNMKGLQEKCAYLAITHLMALSGLWLAIERNSDGAKFPAPLSYGHRCCI